MHSAYPKIDENAKMNIRVEFGGIWNQIIIINYTKIPTLIRVPKPRISTFTAAHLTELSGAVLVALSIHGGKFVRGLFNLNASITMIMQLLPDSSTDMTMLLSF